MYMPHAAMMELELRSPAVSLGRHSMIRSSLAPSSTSLQKHPAPSSSGGVGIDASKRILQRQAAAVIWKLLEWAAEAGEETSGGGRRLPRSRGVEWALLYKAVQTMSCHLQRC